MTTTSLSDVDALIHIRDLVASGLPFDACDIAEVLLAAGYDLTAEVQCSGCGEWATAPIETTPDLDVPGDLLCLRCAP